MTVERRREIARKFGLSFGIEPPGFDMARRYFQGVAQQSFAIPFGLSIEIFDDEQVNAFAASDGFNIIAFSSGLIEFIRTSCSIYGNDPGIFPWLGGVDAPRRLALKSYLFQRTLNFVFFHELAHIRNGHTGLLNSKHGIVRMSEIQAARGDGDLYLDLQTMEYDADTFAAGVLCNDALETSDDRIPANAEWEKDFPGATRVYTDILLTYSFFKAIEGEMDQANIPESTHPPATYRMSLCTQVAIEIAGRKRAIPETIVGRFGLLLKEFEERLPAKISRKFDRSRVTDLFGPESSLYFSRLLHNWVKLRPQLEPYAYGPLPIAQKF